MPAPRLDGLLVFLALLGTTRLVTFLFALPRVLPTFNLAVRVAMRFFRLAIEMPSRNLD